MKSIIKRALSVFICIVLIAGTFCVSGSAQNTVNKTLSFLHTQGENIVDENGEQVVLRGTNFGGWGIMEDWFCPLVSPAGEDVMYQKLVERFGITKTHELMQLYRSNWITEQDYKNVSELGMNVIRLPLWYRNFQSDDNGTWYLDKNGKPDLHELDEAVAMCKKYGLYIIIDMHGLPGYQNDYDHCGKSKSMSLFDETPQGERYREVSKELWVTIAERYKDEPAVAMYDLMNEPLGTNISTEKNAKQIFWDFSNDLYEAIREVDPNHIISMEAIWSPDAIASPDVYGWENIVYQEHLYDVSNPSYLVKMTEIKRAKYNAPFYIGEFYPRGISTFSYLFSLFNKRNMSWTTWTYKGAGDWAENSPWFLYGSNGIQKIDFENDSYETLCEKFGTVLRTDSGNFKKTVFAGYISNFTNGEVDKLSLYTFGLFEGLGTREQRKAMQDDKISAVKTTIKDWIRKLKTGDLL
ncbi:MAG: cellulase family glycosylhydrolase [Clostridia bacterium]|nr:cellulase family glycosylhydrolase [Clostridia bacterium]